MSTLYDDLGVPEDATEEEIKKAYRKKASETHPDKKGGSTEKFQIVQKAFAVLSSPEEKSHYDETGAERNTKTLTNEAMPELASLFMSLVDTEGIDLAKINLIDVCRKHILTVIAKQEQVIPEIHKTIVKREAILKRLKKKKKKKGFALLESTMKRDIQGRYRGIEDTKRRIAISHEMIRLLDEYEYIVDTAPDVPTPTMFFVSYRA
jgi:curved DNA-binding protein CbpA